MDSNFLTGEGRNWLKERATTPRPTPIAGIQTNIIFLATIWELWKARNKLSFDKQRTPARITARIAIARAFEIQEAQSTANRQKTKQNRTASRWSPPPPNMNIGPATVNESELWGLRQGLFLALQLEIKNLIIEIDSSEIAKALLLTGNPSNPAPALLLDCKGLLNLNDAEANIGKLVAFSPITTLIASFVFFEAIYSIFKG